MIRNSTRIGLLAVLAFVLLVAILILTLLPYRAIDNAKANTEILKCQARAEQQFRRDVVDLIEAGRDPAKYEPLIARMQTESHVDYAELDHGHCPTVPDGR